MAKATSKKASGKKASSKKATTAKAAKPAKAAGESRSEKRAALIEKVMNLIDVKGLSVDEAAEKLGVNRSTIIGAHTVGSVKPKDRITGTDEEKAEQIATARDEDNVAWYVIAARADISQSKAKALYEEHTGNASNQGQAVAQRRKAEREAAAPVKAKTGTKKATTKAKAEKVTKNRKKAKGTANPSKG